MLKSGEMLQNYKIVNHLGSGSFGDVYKAQNPNTDSFFALKVCGIRNPEAKILRTLDHPTIVSVLDDFDSDHGHVTVMNLVDGVALAAILECIHGQPRKRLRVEDVLQQLPASGIQPGDNQILQADWKRAPIPQFGCRIVLEVADALRHAHARGVTHRDVKPENILIDRSGSAVLIDWGVAAGQSETKVGDGGTLNYLTTKSLERLAGITGSDEVETETLNVDDDVFALGVVLYELLTGELPFPPIAAGSSVIVAARESLAHRPGLSATIESNRKLPNAVRAILSTSLCPTTVQRYSRVAEFADDLRCYLTQLPLKHLSETWQTRAGRLWNKHRLIWIGLFIFSTSLLIGYEFDRRHVNSQLNIVEDFRQSLLSDGIGRGILPEAIEQALFDSGVFPDTTSQRLKRAQVTHALAATYWNYDASETATSLLKSTVALAPNNGEAQNDLGAALFKLEEYHAALNAFDRALQLDCDHSAVFSNRGAVYAACGDLDLAHQDFLKALEIDPHNAAAARHMELLDEIVQ